MQENRAADFYDVYAGSDRPHRVYRFPGTEKGFLRAKEYARNYNKSLRQAMGLTEADLEIETWDGNQPDQYEKAMAVESYRDHAASVHGEDAVPVIRDNAPLPTDYPHDF